MPDIVNRGDTPPARSELDTFLADLKKKSTSACGRLIFALDATASREATWDTACKLQADMFREAASAGGLDMQLVFYRGANECKASGWLSDPAELARKMTAVMCRSGYTQIRKVLAHAAKETRLLPVSAMVFVGDAFEEQADEVVPIAAELGRLGVRVFMFQEGNERKVERVFREIADVTKGAYCRFDQGSAHQLAELLKAVAGFAVGGVDALTARKDAASIKLLGQIK